MWKDSIINIVAIFQPNILRIVGFYVRHSAIVYCSSLQDLNRMNLTAALRNKFFMGWGSPFVIHKKEKKERIQKNE